MAEQDPPAPRPRSEARTREHLANERTLLAWIRTALGLVGLGFVLARMGLFLGQLAAASVPALHHTIHSGHEFLGAGVVFLVLGAVLSGWSGWLYERSRAAIEAGRYEPARGTALTLALVVAFGGLALAALVVWRMFRDVGPG